MTANYSNNTTIAIIGPGKMGATLGKIWSQAGHQVIFCFGRDQQKLESAARAAGPRTRTAHPAEATAAAEVVVLSVPWNAVDTALEQAGSLAGKILLTIVNPILPDMSGLALGTTTSCAEEIAKKVPEARVVEAIPPFADVLASPSRRFGGEQTVTFYCGDDAAAKHVVADLLADLDVQAVDAGPLRNARYVEPAGFLLVQLQYAPTAKGQYGLHLLVRQPETTREV
jgi:predicted dinucleotide-binding enzyme